MVEKDSRRMSAALTTRLSFSYIHLFNWTWSPHLSATSTRRNHQHSATTQEEAVASLHSMKEQPSPQPQEKPSLPSSQEGATACPTPNSRRHGQLVLTPRSFNCPTSSSTRSNYWYVTPEKKLLLLHSPRRSHHHCILLEKEATATLALPYP